MTPASVEFFFAQVLDEYLQYLSTKVPLGTLSSVIDRYLMTKTPGETETWLQNDARLLYRKLQWLEGVPQSVVDTGEAQPVNTLFLLGSLDPTNNIPLTTIDMITPFPQEPVCAQN